MSRIPSQIMLSRAKALRLIRLLGELQGLLETEIFDLTAYFGSGEHLRKDRRLWREAETLVRFLDQTINPGKIAVGRKASGGNKES